MKTHTHWLDRVTGPIAPGWTLKRQRARIAADLLLRYYEGASTSRRTSGWNRINSDANTAIGPALNHLRASARELVRNNPYAESAVATIADHVVGWGIEAAPLPDSEPIDKLWKSWAWSTACDADGRHDFMGLQKIVMRSVTESGEVLVRRRWRRPDDGFPLPMQIQILEADHLDTSKEGNLANGHRIVQGVEFDAIGRRVAYHLFRDHPGSAQSLSSETVRVPASEVQHVFRGTRPGQVRAASWFAPVLVRFKDFDEFEDATLMKQKIAACLAVITSDVDGSSPAMGTADDTGDPSVDMLEPGMIMNVAPGRNVDVVSPPTTGDYSAYTSVNLRAIATGLGIGYEDITGDYSQVNFSSARMSRLRHQERVNDWRWRMLIPQFCDPVWYWAMEAAVVMGKVQTIPQVRWTPPPMAMIEPDKEGLAIQRNVRSGIMSLSESLRERGMNPDEVFKEMASDNAKLDELGLILDSDPRKMTQAGQMQSADKPGAIVPAT